MKAVGFTTSLPIADTNSFLDLDVAKPAPSGHEILVKVNAVSVNPVDFKIRQNSAKDKVLDTPKVIGWDAAGEVVEVGEEVTLFKKGDAVYYAGNINKQGSNAEYQVVDERIVGRKPERLSFEQAAAMPLTALTAWELLFDRMHIQPGKAGRKVLLVIGGAGGVGSIAIQLAKQVAGITVIATASRPETIDWCRKMGADFVVNHRDLVNEVRNLGFQFVDYIADFVDANGYWESMVELIRPQGHIASITGSSVPFDLIKLKSKSVSFSWEFMFTRPAFETEDMEEQHHILNRIATLLDNGTLACTLTQTLQGLSADTFKQAHMQLESGKTIGKLVISF